jgi:hypothetical protein
MLAFIIVEKTVGRNDLSQKTSKTSCYMPSSYSSSAIETSSYKDLPLKFVLGHQLNDIYTLF